MTPALRKTHRYTWFALAVLLPLGWVSAILVIPGPVCQDPSRAPQPEALSELLGTKQSGHFLVNWRSDHSKTRHQVEILITKPLETPNAVVRIVADDQGDPLPGLLGSRGLYRFDLDRSGAQTIRIRIEDDLKKTTLASFNFE